MDFFGKAIEMNIMLAWLGSMVLLVNLILIIRITYNLMIIRKREEALKRLRKKIQLKKKIDEAFPEVPHQ